MSRLDAITDWVKQAERARYHAGELAAHCLISESQLCRYFHDTFGRPPQEWLDELRLLHAERLLCSGLRAQEVAHQLHFASESHFCRKFKERHGCPPLEFELRYRQRLAEEIERLKERFGENYPRELLPPPPWEIALRTLCQKIDSVPQE